MSTAHYHVRHETLYEYSGEVVHSHQLLHLTPRETPHQSCSGHAISIEPAPASSSTGLDAFGNPVMRLEFDRPHQCLSVIAQMNVEVRERTPARVEEAASSDTRAPDGQITGESWERVRSQLAYAGRPPGTARLEALKYRSESPHVRIKQVFNDYAAECFPAGRPVLECAERLMTKLFKDMTYAPGETNIATPLMEVIGKRRGVCQDFAHLMIACLRSRGLAARYVSGYLRTVPIEEGGTTADPLLGADASHAWVAVYCPTAGWVEFDPTNGVRAGTDHITIAWGRDFGDVSPLRGVIVGGGRHSVNVRVNVAPVTIDS